MVSKTKTLEKNTTNKQNSKNNREEQLFIVFIKQKKHNPLKNKDTSRKK